MRGRPGKSLRSRSSSEGSVSVRGCDMRNQLRLCNVFCVSDRFEFVMHVCYKFVTHVCYKLLCNVKRNFISKPEHQESISIFQCR